MTDEQRTTWPVHEGVLELGDLEVERGGTIRDARLAYATYGTLSPGRDNVIVYPCSYTAKHDELAWLIGPDGVLDPTRWFVVVPDMFSNGLSSSASHADPHDPTAWPAVVTVADNVRAQHRLLTEVFDVQRVVAAYGFSMGAGQAYHWAALYPELVERAVVVCGSARTAVHNQVFLRGLLRILEAAPEHLGGGRFAAEPVAAKRAFAEVYAGWGLSQDFYRAGLYSSVLGFADLDAFLEKDWVEDFARSTAADLYAQASTWLHGDISGGGNLPSALAAIEAKVLLVPSETDLYFRVADNEAELEHLRHGSLAVIPGVWGHWAGSPEGLPAETDFLRTAVRAFLDA
jgi:homoserine O-acetyltransferase